MRTIATDEGAAPTAFVSKGRALTADGMKYTNVEDLTSDFGSNTLIRFGFKAYNNSVDNTLVCTAAGGKIEYLSC